MTPETKKAMDRFEAATEAMKQGVSILVQEQPSQRVSGECGPKYLRVDAIIRMTHVMAISRLLLKAGVFTEEEYFTELADCAEENVSLYEERLTKIMGGRKVTLK